MDSSETREPSYYEVALTNRQVLVAFVVLLTCLLGAFLSGVWVGKGAETGQAATPVVPSPAEAEPIEQLSFFGREPGTRTAARPAESGAEGTSPARPASPAPVAPSPATSIRSPATSAEPAESSASSASSASSEDSAAERMRRTLEAEMAAHREPAPPASAPAEGPTSEPTSEPRTAGERTRRASAEPATRAAAPASPAPPAAAASTAVAASPTSSGTGRVWIQVYSSSNGERAREIVAQLRSAGFPVVLSEAPKPGATGAAATTFRVRVGPYDLRPRAEKTAQRLRREHRLDTWVTDAP